MDRDAILFANEAFYRAFADRDLGAMEEMWAEGVPVMCIHPGWGPLTGRDAVMASWRAILTGRHPPAIRCRGPESFQYGDIAAVICFEVIGQSVLVATNLFVRQQGRWKIAHHQSGPSNQEPPAESDGDSEPQGPVN